MLANKKARPGMATWPGLRLRKKKAEVSSAPHFAFRAGSPYHDLLLSLRRAVSRANRAGDFRTTGVTVSHFPRVPQSSFRSC